MLSGLLAILSLRAQQPVVTFESPGITVKAFCAELERQTGVTVQAWDDVRNDLLALRLTRASLQTVLEKVAAAERARITFDGVAYNLRPDPVARAQARLKVTRDKLRVAKLTQERYRSEQKPGPFDSAAATSAARNLARSIQSAKNTGTSLAVEEQKREFDTPLGRAALRVFCAVPPERLAAAPHTSFDDRLELWSTSPTPVEQALPLDPLALLDTVRSEGSLWNDALAAADLPDDAENYSRRAATLELRSISTLRISVYTEGEIAWVLLVTGYDGQGALVVREPFLFEPPRETAKVADPPRRWPKVEVPAQEAGALDLWSHSSYSNPKRDALISSATFAKLCYDPEHFDPVALTFGRCAVEFSRTMGDQLVASEDVHMATTLPSEVADGKRINLRAFNDYLVNNPSSDTYLSEWSRATECTRTAGWSVIRPYDADANIEFEISREKLGQRLRDARDTGEQSFEETAAWTAASGPRWLQFWFRWPYGYSRVLLPHTNPLEFFPHPSYDFALIRFSGLLSDAQLYAARHDGLPLALCTADQLAELFPYIMSGQVMVAGEESSNLRNCATIAIPRGLPGGGLLKITATVEHGVEFRAKVPDRKAPYVGGAEVSRIGTWLHVVNDRLTWGAWNVLGLRPIRHVVYAFNFTFQGGVSKVILQDVASFDGPEVGTVPDLAEPYRSEVMKSVSAGRVG